jgi:diguanylate cyclase (GGDEF)-like protein/PAS domain S-box-containing protein
MLEALLQRQARTSTCIAAGVFDAQGQALALNQGMHELLCGLRVGDRCAEHFANPRYPDLWARTADQVFFGILTLGDGKRISHSISARAERRGDRLLVFGEVDVSEIHRTNRDLIDLNRTITNLQRELIHKNQLLKQSHKRIARREHLNRALAEINRAIRDCATQSDLLRALCEIVVRCGDFKLAAVYCPGQDERFQLLASAGDVAYLRELTIVMDDKRPEGRGPTPRAWRSALPQITNDFLADPGTRPWHQLAARHGVRASAAIPLCDGDSMLAVLNVYAGTAHFFGDDETQVLLKITGDTGFALSALQERAKAQLSEARYRQIFQNAPVGLVHYDRHGTIVDCNDDYIAIVGSTRERIIGLNLIQDLKDARVIGAVRRSLTQGDAEINLTYHSVTASKITDVRGYFAGIRNLAGEIESGIGVLEDVTVRNRLEQRLRESEERLRLAVDGAGIGVWDYSCERHELHWDGWMLRLHGRRSGAPPDLARWRRLVHPADREAAVRSLRPSLAIGVTASAEFRVRWPDRSLHYLRVFVRRHDDPLEQSARLMGVCYDVTEQKLNEDQIHRLAYYDPLTRLANRRLLLDRLEQAMARCQRNQTRAALLLIDLDGFKEVNDTYGHDAGDELLVILAERLRTALRRADTIARLGGDEFVVLSEGMPADEEMALKAARALADKVLQTTGQPFRLQSASQELYCSASIGVTLCDQHTTGTNPLLKQADIAMFAAKRAGRNAIRFFS